MSQKSSNFEESRNCNNNNTKFKMVATNIRHKLTIALTSCLVIGAILVTADKQQQISNNNNRKQSTYKSSADLATSASISATVHQPVYHSTIDRRDGSKLLAPSGAEQQLAMVGAASSAASGPMPAARPLAADNDLATAAGHHHGHAHGKYYEYREVPKKKTWKFGYKRGNHKHTISRHEHGKAGKKHSHFKTKVKWHDKKSKGKGIHLWDYNHHDKKHGHHG